MISSKLRSRKGASLIVALFLLIVCSTVGSIILTAATANVGRISQRAKYDRKYYAVTSAARLFADEVAEAAKSGITLTVAPDATPPVAAPPGIDIAGNKLQASLQNGLYSIYTGGQNAEALQATAAEYLNGDFSRIGNSANAKHCGSAPRDFTITVKGKDDDTEVTVYGRFAVEALRTKGDPNPGLDSVTHNITAVFYSDVAKDADDKIKDELPESAYVVRLVCPAESPPAVSYSGDGMEMYITFQWRRENMQITPVRGGT